MPQYAAIIKQTAAESGVPADSTQRIISQARKHFFAHGFRGVTMDELARELGMSKKTLYTHVPSKTALLEAILLDKLHELESEVSGITAECAADFVAGLQRLLACLQ